MFDILFGWRKASKCKKLVRLVQCRLKLLKVKRHSIVRQLRDDIARLLKNGHFDSALSRVEQLFKDQNLLAAYDLLEHFCEFIIIHFPYIRKHKDCPNDINEAASTLIFAAAWCGDLPELKMIQKFFGERYGHKFVKGAIGLYPGNLVNDQIREKLCIKSIPEQAKVTLIDEIAKENCGNKLKLNLLKLCGDNGCQWEGFVFKEQAEEVDYKSLSRGRVLGLHNEDRLTDRPVNSIVEPLQVTTMHKSALKMENCKLVGSFNQPKMELSTFSMEVQEECDQDKIKFFFFDSPRFPFGVCSTIGGASFLFLSNYDYGEPEIGKSEEFIRLSQYEKFISHQCGLLYSECRFKHRKSYCRWGFSEDIEFNCSLEHPCYHSLMKFQNENPMKEITELESHSGSCTSSRGSYSHVHPKLPDYDEVAAKFMALKKEHYQRQKLPTAEVRDEMLQENDLFSKDLAIQDHVNLM